MTKLVYAADGREKIDYDFDLHKITKSLCFFCKNLYIKTSQTCSFKAMEARTLNPLSQISGSGDLLCMR